MIKVINFSRVFLAFFIVIFVVSGCGDSSDAGRIERANAYLEKGELNAAQIELKNVLQKNEESSEARLLLGKTHLALGKPVDAEKELRRAIDLGVADETVYSLLAQALYAQGKQVELRTLSIDDIKSNEIQAEVLSAQGLGELLYGNVIGAAPMIDEAATMAPQSTYVAVAGVRLLIAQQKYFLAREKLDSILELSPNNADAWGLLGNLERRDNELVKAEDAYSRAIENRANNLGYLLERAKLRLQLNKVEEAQQDVTELKKRAPGHADVNYVQGVIYFHENRFSEASNAFSQASLSNPEDPDTIFYQALTHLRLGNGQQAEQYTRQFLALVPQSVPGRKLMAHFEIRNEQYESALDFILPVVENRGDDFQASNMLASALLRTDRVDEAIQLLEETAVSQPNSSGAQLRLGVAFLAADRSLEGIDQIKRAVEMEPQLYKAHEYLILGYLKQGDQVKAMAAAEAYREIAPDRVEPYIFIARLQLIAGEQQSALKTFQKALEVDGGNAAANHGLAAVAAQHQDFNKAREHYQDVLKYHDNHLPTLMKLVALDIEENNRELMLEHIQQAVKSHPDELAPKLMLARYHLIQGEPEMAVSILRELSPAERQIPPVLQTMALSHIALKQYPEAKYSLEQLIQLQPGSAQLHFMLARVYSGLKDYTDMEQELEKALELSPEFFTARLVLAELEFMQGKEEEAVKHLSVLEEASPNHPDVLRLKAGMAKLRGDEVAAEQLLEGAFRVAPDTASLLSVTRQKWSMGEKEKALELEALWALKNPDDLVAAMSLASSYSKLDRREDAIEQYKRVIAKDEENILALNNLAWGLRNTHPEEALEYANRAVTLAPDSAPVLDTLAVVLLKNGQTKNALRQIERALDREPDNPYFLYHSAMINVSIGDKEEAKAILQALLKEELDFSEKSAAQQLWEEL